MTARRSGRRQRRSKYAPLRRRLRAGGGWIGRTRVGLVDRLGFGGRRCRSSQPLRGTATQRLRPSARRGRRSCGAARIGLTGGFADPPAPRGATGADARPIAGAAPTAGAASAGEGLTPTVEAARAAPACVSRRSCVESGARTDDPSAGFPFSLAVSAGANEGASITVAPAAGEGLALTAPEVEEAK